MPQYWLMKTEPDTFSFDDLERVKVEPWSGVRSNFARFHMRNMTVGDEVLFYHSSCEPPGVAGLAKVVRTKVIDETQFDPASPYYDPKATREKPIWDCVDVEIVRRLPRFVSLHEIRNEPPLADMPLLQRGQRLSVQPVTAEQFAYIVEMANQPAKPLPEAAAVTKPAAKKAAPKKTAKTAPKPKKKTKPTPRARGAARAPTKPPRGPAARSARARRRRAS